MAEGGHWKLTDELISKLAEAIPEEKLESIATRYLEIETPSIQNLKTKHRENVEAVSSQQRDSGTVEEQTRRASPCQGLFWVHGWEEFVGHDSGADPGFW